MLQLPTSLESPLIWIEDILNPPTLFIGQSEALVLGRQELVTPLAWEASSKGDRPIAVVVNLLSCILNISILPAMEFLLAMREACYTTHLPNWFGCGTTSALPHPTPMQTTQLS